MITGRPSPCTPRSGRTHATRARDVVRLETGISQGLVWITRQKQKVKWPVFAPIIVIVIDIYFGVFGMVMIIIVVVVIVIEIILALSYRNVSGFETQHY